MEIIKAINEFSENEKIRQENIIKIIEGYSDLLQEIAVDLWNNDRNNIRSTFKIINKELRMLVYTYKTYNDIAHILHALTNCNCATSNCLI